jgi:hypothetical protein
LTLAGFDLSQEGERLPRLLLDAGVWISPGPGDRARSLGGDEIDDQRATRSSDRTLRSVGARRENQAFIPRLGRRGDELALGRSLMLTAAPNSMLRVSRHANVDEMLADHRAVLVVCWGVLKTSAVIEVGIRPGRTILPAAHEIPSADRRRPAAMTDACRHAWPNRREQEGREQKSTHNINRSQFRPNGVDASQKLGAFVEFGPRPQERSFLVNVGRRASPRERPPV